MLQLLIVRPGMTELDLSHRLKGNLDIPLCPLGVEQAADIAQQVRAAGTIEAIYSAPCQASRQTAEQLARGCDVKLHVCQELANLDLGLWSGLCQDDIRQRQPTVYRRWQENPETVCPPQGEMLHDARLRTHPVLARIAKKFRQGRIVLVIPEPMATILSCQLRGLPVCDLWKAENNFGTFQSVDYQPGSVPAPRS